MFFVEFIFDVCRDKIDYCGERGVGLWGVGCAVDCEAPAWFCEFELVVEGG